MNAVSQRKFNWWALALALSLIAFEIAREAAVIATNEPLTGGGLTVVGLPAVGFVEASGQWLRSDGGSPIVPTSVAIRCDRESARCIEATTTVMSGRTLYTHIDVFEEVVFSEDAVSYSNDMPDCATYQVRIDLTQKRVIATRERKPGGTLDCDKLEKRVVMELGDGFLQRRERRWMDRHFLPITRIFLALTA